MRALLLASLLMLSACASRGGIPVEPYDDVPVPRDWMPYSREWMAIHTPSVTAAKFIYFTETKVDPTLERARQLLASAGWAETKSERFVNPQRFPGVWADFTKGGDSCRVTVIEGPHATHVDYVVARANRVK